MVLTCVTLLVTSQGATLSEAEVSPWFVHHRLLVVGVEGRIQRLQSLGGNKGSYCQA